MIKILKNKFLICLFVLVVSIFITSSCYATITDITETCNTPFTLDDVYNEVSSLGFTKDNSVVLVIYRSFSDGSSGYNIWVISTNSGLSYIKEGWANHTSGKAFNVSDKSVSCDYYSFSFDIEDNVFEHITLEISNSSTFVSMGSGDYPPKVGDISTITFKRFDGSIIYEPSKYNLGFDYSLTGVKRGQCKLTIDGLDSSLRMFGYVGLDSFPNGEFLDVSSNIENLRLLATKTDNSDLYCYLYDGEELVYYIVDEDYTILDVGYISDMAKGDFLYGFNVYDGVDFVFLKDGQVYWDNNLTFKYCLNSSSNLLENNNILSAGSSTYIDSNKNVATGIYSGYVYDSNNVLLSSADVTFSNNLSESISISVNTSYYENNVGWNKSCYWLQSIFLTGRDSTGNDIDFSNYSVRWSIPTWLNIDSIEVNGSSYSKYSGTLTGFTSSGVLSMFNLKIYELINNHTSAFNITLEVFDNNDNKVLTHIINSDDIVDKQISNNENNIDKEDFDIVDNPNYTGGTNTSVNIDNIQDWTVDDYTKLMSTDNFVWEFFKAILGNLPWWVTVPLTILIFGVVIITLIRFARGA